MTRAVSDEVKTLSRQQLCGTNKRLSNYLTHSNREEISRTRNSSNTRFYLSTRETKNKVRFLNSPDFFDIFLKITFGFWSIEKRIKFNHWYWIMLTICLIDLFFDNKIRIWIWCWWSRCWCQCSFYWCTGLK